MIALFFRTAAIIGSAVLATLVLRAVLLEENEEQSIERLLSGPARLIAAQVAATPAAHRRDLEEDLSQQVGYPVQLEPLRGARTRTERRGLLLYVVAPVPHSEGQVSIGPIPYGKAQRFVDALVIGLMVTVALSLIALVPVSRRLRTLEALAERMRDGDFRARIVRRDGDVFDRVGASLNSLADRIGQLLSDERDLLRTVAHEVRAPIARMRFRVDKLHRIVSPESGNVTTGLVSDLAQVDQLFEELLTYVAFNEFDQGGPRLTTTTIFVKEAVERVVAEVTDVDESVAVGVSGSSACTIEANLKLFERSVTNLLLNAMVYGGPRIEVIIRPRDEYCIVDVQDSGPGIPPEDRPEVIKPFVRLRTEKKKRGTGLGLAIVTRIMRLHAGALYILDAPSGGASIQLVYPQKLPKRKKGDRGLTRL